MSFLQKIKSGAAKAADKAQRTVETTKLSAQIARKRKELKDNYTEIGAAVYKAYQSGNLSLAEPEITRLSQENERIEQVIAGLHDRIRELNDEQLCLCGQTVQGHAQFCSACGRKLEPELRPESPHEAAEEADPDSEEEATWTTEAAASADVQEDTPIYEGIAEIRCKQCGEFLRPEDQACFRCGALQSPPRDPAP